MFMNQQKDILHKSIKKLPLTDAGYIQNKNANYRKKRARSYQIWILINTYQPIQQFNKKYKEIFSTD